MAVLAYIIFLIPLLAAKDSKFARYHTNQGLVLFLAALAFSVIISIVISILFFHLMAGRIGSEQYPMASKLDICSAFHHRHYQCP